MNTYKCRLINKRIVKECFFRQANSKKELLEGLKMFKWGKGQWVIE